MGIDSSNQSGGMMQKAASVAAGAASELAKGAGSLIKEKACEAASNFQEKASQTIGGQLASAIEGEPSFEGDSLSADSTPFGHSAHADPDTCSTIMRTGSRSAATQGWHC